MVLPIGRSLARVLPAAFGAAPAGARLRRVAGSPQFVSGALRNTDPTTVIAPGSSARVLYAQLTGWDRRKPGMRVPTHPFRASEYAQLPASGLRLTWLGHATVLAELGGRRVLFDPVWSPRCSPVPFAGPRRLHPAPIPVRALRAVDVVVISHDHYDHLDMPTVRKLAAGTAARFAVPLGIGAHLEHWGIPGERITELDWHESARIAGLTLTATPARHYCGRGLRPSRTTLWCSWVVASQTHRIFHGGDTGPFPGLAAIGARHGPFDATMLPVGAYHDYWPDVHMTPEQSVRAHHDLGGAAMLPIHWATYNLAPHPWSEPAERTLAAAREAGTALLTPLLGQPIEPHTAVPAAQAIPWWRPGHLSSPGARGLIPVLPDRQRLSGVLSATSGDRMNRDNGG